MECVYCGGAIVIVDGQRQLDPGLCWDCTIARIVLTAEPSVMKNNLKLAKTLFGLLAASAEVEGRYVEDNGEGWSAGMPQRRTPKKRLH